MALVFGLLSSITGIFSALIAYFTLRAMRPVNNPVCSKTDFSFDMNIHIESCVTNFLGVAPPKADEA
ncbi:hypothetical protein OIDMADRAFT_59082 [Oidiodendron maius Zn]|uniref:Uncharacterized protein n=1 Tax=Oidiodendron maius (strain Zn) TaxID=913774 RepID=A0A0C3GXM7_OIDMZ|nr:hypothetical protein OIDMADRAFT_59082 [Oidiodendron maius Zn]